MPAQEGNAMIVIYHNPKCGTSRNALAAIRASGSEPQVIEYLQTGWTRGQLLSLLAVAGLSVRDLLRSKAPEAAVLERAGGEEILAAMVANPVLVERPIVVSSKGVRLCRPVETVLEVLEQPLPAGFVKENGQPLAG